MKMEVWLESHERRIGVLERAETKALTFTYDEGMSASGQISFSLPVRAEPYTDGECRGYFENLVYEGPQLDRLLASYRLDRDDIGTLLYHVGGDCPGAVSVTPEGQGPGKRPGRFPEDYDLISEERLLGIVWSLHEQRAVPESEIDPSPVAGVQGKIAVVVEGRRYYLPRVGTGAPTTHILKVSPQREPDLTEQEGALLNLARICGVPVTGFELKRFDANGRNIKAILLERFDRKIVNGRIHRIHVEDFCQALGLSPLLKYERKSVSATHRFSARAIGGLAARVSAPGIFIERFIDQTLFNLLVGNTDNHAKNASVLYAMRETELAPLYDVVPVFMDRTVIHQFSFAIGEAQYAEDLSMAALKTMAADLGVQNPRYEKHLLSRMLMMVQRFRETMDQMGSKALADALAEQMTVVATALDVKLGVPVRDYYNRICRDERQGAGGWADLS